MFAGVVEELGRVLKNTIERDGRLEIATARLAGRLDEGGSVAVSGCCLTVLSTGPQSFTADVMPETARRSTIAGLHRDDVVNLEAALAYGDPVGGHLVTGHVDGVGAITERHEEGNAVWVTVTAPAGFGRYLVEKGCIAVDGISLTVVEVHGAHFTVSLIPHTVAVTTAQTWRPGRRVNLEADILAKYVQRAVTPMARQVEERAGGRP